MLAEVFVESAEHVTRCAHEPAVSFETLQMFWADPRPFEAERAAKFVEHDAAMAAHDRRLRERQEAIWAEEARA